MGYGVYAATLTSDSSGDATASLSDGVVVGELVEVVVHNGSGSSQPSNNWDLTVYTGTDGGNNDKVLFYDATVSQANTSAVVYNPVRTASIASDGSDSSLTESRPAIHGVMKLIGANMGDTKSAVVKAIVRTP